MKKLRVHVLYEYGIDSRPHGCAYIRLLLPLGHPSNADGLIVTDGKTYAEADVVVIDRTWAPGISTQIASQLIKQARADNTCVVYSIDDNLIDLKPTGFNRWPFTMEEIMAMRYFARESDGVIVSTDLLRERMSRLNDVVAVVPNALDERLWQIPDASGNSGRKTIGYMGTATHDSDLMMILNPLRDTLRKYKGQVELQLIGVAADRAVLEAFDGLPIKVLDVGNNVEYPSFARWMSENVKWDIAIAPLEDDQFTRCKSDIKFLDYSILGMAGIYSRVAPYEKTVRHLETGYLAENTTESWRDGLEQLISNDDLRINIAKRAQEYTLSCRTLKSRAVDWQVALETIFNARSTKSNTQSDFVGTSLTEKVLNA